MGTINLTHANPTLLLFPFRVSVAFCMQCAISNHLTISSTNVEIP